MANAEHVELVRSGVEAVNRFASENDGVTLDLEGADLHGLDLREARIQAACLADANLEGADLRGARIHAADMRRCNLRGADLRGAGMHRADLTGADLRGARLEKMGESGQQMCISAASFEGVHWDRAELESILDIINLNPDWEIRYQVVPRAGQ